MTCSGILGAGQGPESAGTPWIGLGICCKIQVFLQRSVFLQCRPSPHPLLRAPLPPAPSLLPWDPSAAHVQQQRGSCPAHRGASRLLLPVIGGGICMLCVLCVCVVCRVCRVCVVCSVCMHVCSQCVVCPVCMCGVCRVCVCPSVYRRAGPAPHAHPA